MTHRIKSVTPIDGHILLVIFQDGTEKKYDMRNMYSIYPPFKEFEINPTLFNSVKVDMGGLGVIWNDKLDFNSEDIWYDGVATGVIHPISDLEQLAVNLTNARNSVDMTQRELGEATGIYQGDISKIENGTANPTFSTLKRLADAMNMRLDIKFVPNK